MKIYICKGCGRDAHTFAQAALLVGRKASLQVECVTADCPHFKLTTDTRDAVEIEQRFDVQELAVSE